MANPTNPPGPTPNPTPTPAPAPQPAPNPTPAPQPPRRISRTLPSLTQFWNKHYMKFWGVLGVFLVLVFFVSVFLIIDPVGRYQNYKKQHTEEDSKSQTSPNTSDLVTVPITNTSPDSIVLDSNSREGVSVSHSTNGNAIKVVGNKDSRVIISIGSDNPTIAQSRNPLLNPDRVIKLDALRDGKIEAITGFYYITNTVNALENVLFQIPTGWAMQASTLPYPPGMVKALDERGNPLNGKLVSGGCMLVQNCSSTIDVELRWECMIIATSGK